MAFVKNALQELADGKMYLKITPGRAQAMLTALAIALASGELDKRMKGGRQRDAGTSVRSGIGKSAASQSALLCVRCEGHRSQWRTSNQRSDTHSMFIGGLLAVPIAPRRLEVLAVLVLLVNRGGHRTRS